MTGLPSGTVTFLFTDLEGSTGMWEKHPHEMRAASARHDAILRAAVEAHRGHVVKSTGDGVHAVFAAAPDAVAAAADAVQAFNSETWGSTGPLRIRVGIHTGEADERDGDYFGLALSLASRLMAAAHGGQVVMSHVSADLVRDVLPDELELLDLGEHRLRGLEQPEHVYELAASGLVPQFPPLRSLDAFPGALALPAPSFAPDDEGLAGRRDELERLERAWQRAVDGTRQLALVAGEPGIGKTRLAGALAHRVHRQGGVVLYGRCDEEAIVPYQPFVEALRPSVALYATSTLHESVYGLEHDLARVFPELSSRIPAAPEPMSGDPVAERYRFFEALTALLTGITATRATVLVLDDLHWADKPTLLLLRHLIRSTSRVSLLIVACYRDVDLRREDQLADLLADMRREPFVTRVTLTGLSAEDSGELLRGLTEREVGPSLAAALHRETDGNPFFVEELVRHLVETDALPLVNGGGVPGAELGRVDLPESVREVIAQRLRRLPATVNDLLTLAAVVGREFDTGVLRRASGAPPESILESLDRAAEAGLVREDPAQMGRYAFSHAIIRQTLTTALATASRARLHARVGAALEKTLGSGPPAAELALHFARAAPLVGADKAITYATQAGHNAVSDLAFEDAVTHFDGALQLLEQSEPSEPRRRVELLTDLASALVHVDERSGVEAGFRAVDAARTDGSPTQFGRAVAVVVEPAYGVMAFPARITNLFDEARSVLGHGDVALRARLLAFEAFKYATHTLHGRESRVLAEAAVALARQSDDAVTLADALYALAVSLEGAPHLTQRMALGEELVDLGRRAGARAAAFGLRVLAGVHLERGDATALSSTIDDLGRVGAEQRWVPAHAYTAQYRVTQALLEGNFDEVRSQGAALHRYARAYHGASGMHFMQSIYLAREQGDLRGQSVAVRIADDPAYDLYTWASLALAQLDAGDESAARRTLDRVVAEGLSQRETETGFGSALAMLAEVTASVGTPVHAAALHDLLTPFGGQLLAVVLGLACLGAADRYLGMVTTVLGQWDEAAAHFERALGIEERARGRALMPRTRYWQARFLRARGQADDVRAAARILATVIADTSRLGMLGLRAQAEALRAR